MKKVGFMGSGQLNGSVSINKTIIMDDKVAISLTGPNRDEVKRAVLAIHYSGVRINPRQISVSVSNHREEK